MQFNRTASSTVYRYQNVVEWSCCYVCSKCWIHQGDPLYLMEGRTNLNSVHITVKLILVLGHKLSTTWKKYLTMLVWLLCWKRHDFPISMRVFLIIDDSNTLALFGYLIKFLQASLVLCCQVGEALWSRSLDP